MRTAACLALAALLVLPGGAWGQASQRQSAEEAVLAPLQVALRDLPGIIAHALNESERRLLSDEAQAMLAKELDYVRGFSALPPGGGALREADVREAYAWIEAVVEAANGIPPTFDGSQRAGAACRAAFAGAPLDDPAATITLGYDAVDLLEVLRADLQALLDDAPAILDVTPLAQAVALIDGYWVDVTPGILDCLAQLEAQTGEVARVPLKAVVLPATSFPTGHVRVVGTAPLGAQVRVQATTLGVDAGPGLVKGAFRQSITVPRTAALADHAIVVTAGDLRVDLVLHVAKAPVQLDLHAPAHVLSNRTFVATATVSSPAAVGDVDRVPVRLTWRAQPSSLALANGTAAHRLEAGAPGTFVLSAAFPGSAILASDLANVTVQVGDVLPAAASGQRSFANPIPSPGGSLPVAWFWWILLLVLALAFGLALYMSPVAQHRLRRPRTAVVRGARPPPRWPGATSFAAAVGALFEVLRRLGVVPPGRTVQEWMHATKAPTALADQFDAVRYGGAVESHQTTSQGVDWARKAWEWWTKR